MPDSECLVAHKLKVWADNTAAPFATQKAARHRLGVVTEEVQTAENAWPLAYLNDRSVRGAAADRGQVRR